MTAFTLGSSSREPGGGGLGRWGKSIARAWNRHSPPLCSDLPLYWDTLQVRSPGFPPHLVSCTPDVLPSTQVCGHQKHKWPTDGRGGLV